MAVPRAVTQHPDRLSHDRLDRGAPRLSAGRAILQAIRPRLRATAYNHAVEVDSTFALAHLRRALVIGWTGGYESPASSEAATAAVRFGGRLPPRDRRLLAAYHVFDLGKPPAIDSLRAFLADYPGDVEGWYMYGEALFHLREFRPSSPDTIMAAFDRVLRADSSLIPAVIHPIELALLYRDTVKLARYQRLWERYAPRLVAKRSKWRER